MTGTDDSEEDLDELLNAALDDFDVVDSTESAQAEADGASSKGESDACKPRTDAPQSSDIRSGDADVEADNELSPDVLAEALKALNQSNAGERGPGESALEDELMKMLMGDGANSLLDNLFSPEVLKDPMLQWRDKYDRFLSESGDSVSEDDLERYRKQRACVDEICLQYENGSTDTNNIVKLIKKVNDYGDPPPGLLDELENAATGADSDETSNAETSTSTSRSRSAAAGPSTQAPDGMPTSDELKALQSTLEQCQVQ